MTCFNDTFILIEIIWFDFFTPLGEVCVHVVNETDHPAEDFSFLTKA